MNPAGNEEDYNSHKLELQAALHCSQVLKGLTLVSINRF